MAKRSSLDLAQVEAADLRRLLEEFAGEAGLGAGAIPDDMGFRSWCETLAARGLKVDRKPFRLDNRPALLPVYDAIPTTRAEAHRWTLVIQKATQLGLTIWETLADLYMASKWSPVNIGLYLPDQSTAAFKSEQRFMPILRSAPELYQQLVNRKNPDGTLSRIGEGNIMTREYANSLIMFLWTSGKVSTESRPMDVVSLDEVQEMTLDQIDKVFARVGDSELQYKLLLSTANMPDADINRWYNLGTQEVWHTLCDTCGELSDLSDPNTHFPDHAIGYNTGGKYPGAEPDEYVWTCPHCKAWIPDAQRGRYIAANPSAAAQKIKSMLLPRTISPRITPREMLDGWRRARTGDQKKSYFNRTLARPFIDANQLPVTLAHCEAAAAEGKRLGLRWETHAPVGQGPYYMGIDQMGGWCAIIIKRRLPDGRQAVAHCEAFFGADPFGRCTELMKLFRVSVCCLEQLPNVNDARRFVNMDAHRGRVFLNTGFSADVKADMITWADAATRSDQRTAIEDRSRYTVILSQYKAMQAALWRIRNLECLFPDPDELVADVLDDGSPKRVMLLRDWVWDHFTKTALVIEQDEEERKPKAKVKKIALDPHFSFANMLCDVAWAREQGTGTIILPELPEPGPQTDKGRAIAEAMPGLPAAVVAAIESLPQGVCGRCTGFEDVGNGQGRCRKRAFNVGERDASCFLYSKRRD